MSDKLKPEEQLQPNFILKYCIFEGINKDYGNITSLIINSRNVLINGGKIQQCKLDYGMSNIMKYKSSFYAINPLIRPIPVGTILIGIKTNLGYPYSSISIDRIDDMFFLDDDTVYLIVWGKNVPYSVPLYIFTYNDLIFTSYTNSPPSKYWKRHTLSPIFILPNINHLDYNPVINKVSNSENNNKHFQIDKYGDIIYTFSSYQGRCIPDPNGVPFQNCIIINNPNINNTLKFKKPPTLLEQLYIENKTIEDEDKKYRKKYIFIGIILLLFLVSFIVCIIILIKN